MSILCCPMCKGPMKDQVYIDSGLEHGTFYCVDSDCFMPPIVFKGRAEHKAIKKKLIGTCGLPEAISSTKQT